MLLEKVKMGCINSKEIKEEVKQELSLSSQISISMSELTYIEPIKTKEQKQIEKIQEVFKVEYEKNIRYSIYNK